VKLASDCFTVGLYCVKKHGKNLQTFTSATVMVADNWRHVTVEREHLAALAGNAARQ